MMADRHASGETHLLVVPPGAGAQRVDRFVADATGLSRSYVQRLIADGRLTAEERPLKANAIVVGGTELRLEVPPPASVEVGAEPGIPVHVVHEDDDLLIVDKPAGLVVHPSAGHASGTLVNALLGRADAAEYGGIAGIRRPGIVHRLDRDTSGLLMVAKNDVAQASLMAQLKARRVKKTYLALVQGSVSAAVGRIEAPIGRDPRHRTRMAVVPDGRAATTGYRVRERFPEWTLVELDLVTGRTHQIRVHLDAIGHPVAGDPVYGTGTSRRGPDGLQRLFLHASRLELASPSGSGLIRAEAPLPDDLDEVLERLRGAASLPGSGRSTQERRTSRSEGTHDADHGDEPAPGALLAIISGPSGVGKDTIIEALRRRPRERDYHYLVTCTTRARRAGEVDGVNYHFIDRGEFERLREAGEFLEANEVHGNWYGTPRTQVREALAAGRDVILKIDVQGAQVVKEKVPEALLIFIVPPSLEDLFLRLRNRATETADELEVRQRNAAIELARQHDYDYVVVNETDQVELTAQRIDEIIAEQHRLYPDRVVSVYPRRGVRA
jgi:23S rRNA pseudouridine1911/1915/1917 synthase